MWLLKKASDAVGSAYSYSKELVVGKSEPQDELLSVLDELVNEKAEIIPTKKLDQVVAFSYDIDRFEQISDWIQEHLRIFKYVPIAIKQTVNVLTIVYYLIKHGASGFIDVFRGCMKMFQNYQKLGKRVVSEDEAEQKECETNLDIIVSKARHIEILLTDKEKLLRQKELAMLIKQKVKLYEEKQVSKLKQSAGSTKKEEQPPKKTASTEEEVISGQSTKKRSKSTFNDILENYVWKYVDSLDDKLEDVSAKVMSRLDKIVDRMIDGEERPEGEFELGDSDDEGGDRSVQIQIPKPRNDLEIIDKITKQIDGLDIKQEDLLDLEEEKQPKAKPAKVETADLI